MKKNLLASVALSALLLVGCGSSIKDMQDTKEKDGNYYEAHQEEALDKVKWCFKKVELDENIIQDTIEDTKESGKSFSFGDLESIVLDKLETSKAYNEFDKINQSNCSNAYRVVFKAEFVKVFPDWFK